MLVTKPATVNGLWYLIAAGCLWGTGGLTGTLLAREAGLSPLGVAAARLGVGGLALVAALLLTRGRAAFLLTRGRAAFLLTRGRAAPFVSRRPLSRGRADLLVVRRPLPRDSADLGVARRPLPRGRAAWTRIVVVGLLAALFQASYFAAVARTTVSLATLLTIGASPVLVLLAEALTGRRRVGAATLATAGLALAGLTLLVGVPSGAADPADTLVGAAFALLAAAGFGTMTLVGARPVEGLDELASTGFAFTLGAAVLTPLALADGLTFTPTPAAFGLLLLLGIGPTALGYAAYFRGLHSTAAGTASLMALLEPLVGTALAVVLLGDRLGSAGWIGAALLIAALVLESRTTATSVPRPRQWPGDFSDRAR
ncbi:EamA family transporter [Actinoplanes sp. URMC 104]|uniref:EamA family transporter n=1 Tax=Actinoplanes sp. URMC 104 TaxID=3423409 RepID=UPI003F1B18B3